MDYRYPAGGGSQSSKLRYRFLRSDEYTKMLSLAGGNPRDYALLQVFLQTGIRVSELANLKMEHVDFIKPAIRVRGKGNQEREISLKKRGMQALKNYLAVRPACLSDILFLNYSKLTPCDLKAFVHRWLWDFLDSSWGRKTYLKWNKLLSHLVSINPPEGQRCPDEHDRRLLI